MTSVPEYPEKKPYHEQDNQPAAPPAVPAAAYNTTASNDNEATPFANNQQSYHDQNPQYNPQTDPRLQQQQGYYYPPPPPNTNPDFVTPIPVSGWSTGFFSFMDDIDSVIELVFCGYCQLSRQYNVIFQGENKPNGFVWMVPLLIDIIYGYGLGYFGLTWYMRNKVRNRYQIEGNDVDDCLRSFFCPACVGCQNYREMSLRNEWPGGACVNSPFRLPPPPPMMGTPQPTEGYPFKQ